ncbi:MAG: alpha/beta hydrolase, partial [Actinomycetota bacterium]|nr:alpha/beta hydrolase [Actinomycetota bacterium]
LAQDLAQGFGGAGIASYRYDRRGTGESKLDPDTRLTFDDMVADARAGLDLLAQRKETSGRDLTVVGYDLGGLVALRLAATDDRVKRVVLISSPGRTAADVQAAHLAALYGPESADALRATVANLLATRTLPPIDEL